MKSFKKIFILFLLCELNVIAAHAGCVAPNQVIPFQNLSLNPNCTVEATFSFGNFSQLFCYTNTTETTGSIIWPFQGAPQSGSIPILLSINSKFTGQPIDSSGHIIIQNSTSPQPIILSCVFTY